MTVKKNDSLEEDELSLWCRARDVSLLVMLLCHPHAKRFSCCLLSLPPPVSDRRFIGGTYWQVWSDALFKSSLCAHLLFLHACIYLFMYWLFDIILFVLCALNDLIVSYNIYLGWNFKDQLTSRRCISCRHIPITETTPQKVKWIVNEYFITYNRFLVKI